MRSLMTSNRQYKRKYFCKNLCQMDSISATLLRNVSAHETQPLLESSPTWTPSIWCSCGTSCCHKLTYKSICSCNQTPLQNSPHTPTSTVHTISTVILLPHWALVVRDTPSWQHNACHPQRPDSRISLPHAQRICSKSGIFLTMLLSKSTQFSLTGHATNIDQDHPGGLLCLLDALLCKGCQHTLPRIW